MNDEDIEQRFLILEERGKFQGRLLATMSWMLVVVVGCLVYLGYQLP